MIDSRFVCLFICFGEVVRLTKAQGWEIMDANQASLSTAEYFIHIILLILIILQGGHQHHQFFNTGRELRLRKGLQT